MIRPYKTTDRARLIEIMRLNTPKYFAVSEINDYQQYLEKHNDTYFTIFDNEKIAGGIGYIMDDQDKLGKITWIFMDPDCTGRGLASVAMEHCLKKLQANSSLAKWEVRTSQLANTFFEKFGFHLIRIEKDYWAEGLDLYLMEQVPKL